MEKCIYECFALRGANEALFQSNKSRQINPNMSRQIQTASVTTRFKHINSDRSIPTKDVPILRLTSRKVSIVSIKTDLSRRFPARTWPVLPPVSFNRINPNRSIPTLRNAVGLRGVKSMFQSYQSRQINPDTGLPEPQPDTLFMFQSYQSRQINPDAISS